MCADSFTRIIIKTTRSVMMCVRGERNQRDRKDFRGALLKSLALEDSVLFLFAPCAVLTAQQSFYKMLLLCFGRLPSRLPALLLL